MFDFYGIFLFLIVLLSLFCINTILGIFLNTRFESFCFKKLFYGFFKLLIISIVVFLYFFIIEISPDIFSRIGISIDSSMFNFIEFFGIFITAYKKYLSDCYEKLKKILNML